MRQLPESIILQTEKYKHLQSLFSILYNEATQLRQSWDEVQKQMHLLKSSFNTAQETAEVRFMYFLCSWFWLAKALIDCAAIIPLLYKAIESYFTERLSNPTKKYSSRINQIGRFKWSNTSWDSATKNGIGTIDGRKQSVRIAEFRNEETHELDAGLL